MVPNAELNDDNNCLGSGPLSWKPEFDSRIGHHVEKGKRGACQQKAATVLPNRTAAT